MEHCSLCGCVRRFLDSPHCKKRLLRRKQHLHFHSQISLQLHGLRDVEEEAGDRSTALKPSVVRHVERHSLCGRVRRFLELPRCKKRFLRGGSTYRKIFIYSRISPNGPVQMQSCLAWTSRSRRRSLPTGSTAPKTTAVGDVERHLLCGRVHQCLNLPQCNRGVPVQMHSGHWCLARTLRR